jgi:hypothetical protein
MLARNRALATLVAAICAALAILAVPAFAAASDYIVNSTGDSPETAGCESSPEGECTLRGAIEASNANPVSNLGQNLIDFGSEFEGVAGNDEIQLSEPLHVESRAAIVGNSCEGPTPQIAKPCVGVVGPANAAADFVVESDGVSIYFVAIGGAKVGVEVPTANGFVAAGDWFGLGLDGTAKGLSEAGIALGSGSGALIGQSGDGSQPAREEKILRNVFGHSRTGVSMIGSRRATVIGNYIGVGPDGQTVSGLNTGIQIVGEESAPAEEDAIGGELTQAQAESTTCDGPCNVIATTGAEAVGIKLAGAFGENVESPRGPTQIAGNYIGLSADGTTKVGEAKWDIRAGATPGTTTGPTDVSIGGARDPEGFSPFGNYIVGGEVAVRVDHANGFLAEENVIGALPAPGATGEARPEVGFEVTAQGVAERPEIIRNAMSIQPDGIGIDSLDEGSVILVNRIVGGRWSILATGADQGEGNLIQGNLILHPEWIGIEVENDANVLVGNWIFEAGRVGIVLAGGGGLYPSENQIGGDTPDEENRIEESPEGAIQIYGEPGDDNEVAGNWGDDHPENGAGEPFIHLIGHSSSEPPNGGIKPPTVELVEGTTASGTAVPGAKVRLFYKGTTDPGELQSEIATATADSSGHWTATFATKLAAGALVAATQTADAGTPEAATSEVSAPVAAIAEDEEASGGGGGGGSGGRGGSGSDGSGEGGSSTGPSGSGPSNPSPAPGSATTPIVSSKPPAPREPKVRITGSPKAKSTATTARFTFTATPVAGAKFQCRLDGAKKWTSCRSPQTYKHLAPGRHTFEVRALAAGLTGPVTKYQFTVKS